MSMFFKTRNHVNILNLLAKYELRFQDETKQDWRLRAYLDSIFAMIDEEERLYGPLNDELIGSRQKANFFRGVIEARSQASTLPNKYTAISACSPIIDELSNYALSESIRNSTKTIFQSQKAKCEAEIRRELFATKTKTDKSSAEAAVASSSTHVQKNYDDIVRYHNQLQEQMTTEMVGLARNLKTNVAISNEIVKKDNELLESTNKFAEGTVDKLKTNTSRVAEFANAACEYWLWICLFLVTATFFSMVIFIRLFPKRRLYNPAPPMVTTTPMPPIDSYNFLGSRDDL